MLSIDELLSDTGISENDFLVIGKTISSIEELLDKSNNLNSIFNKLNFNIIKTQENEVICDLNYNKEELRNYDNLCNLSNLIYNSFANFLKKEDNCINYINNRSPYFIKSFYSSYVINLIIEKDNIKLRIQIKKNDLSRLELKHFLPARLSLFVFDIKLFEISYGSMEIKKIVSIESFSKNHNKHDRKFPNGSILNFPAHRTVRFTNKTIVGFRENYYSSNFLILRREENYGRDINVSFLVINKKSLSFWLERMKEESSLGASVVSEFEAF